MQQRETKEKRGCCLFALLQGILLVAVLIGGLVLMRDSGLLSRIYQYGKGQLHKLPGSERMASSEDDKMINDEKELVDYVNDQLETGHESFVFLTEELDDNFINNINSCTEAFYGSCSNYTTTDFGSYRRVKMTCSLTDAYYVEKNILNDEEIPSDRKEAVKLAARCQEILDGMKVDKNSEYRKEKYFHDYLVGHTVYTTEEEEKGDQDLLSSPAGPLLYGKGVCSGYARAMKLLCDLAGVKCKTIVGVGNGVDHEWNMVKIKNHWYHVDVTWDDPVPDQDHPMYAYLNLSDEAIAKDHIWEKEYYPSANSLVYDYYLLNEAFCDDYEAFYFYMQEKLKDHPKTVRVMVGDYSKENYSEENLKFLFELSGASSYSFSTCGPEGRTEIYFVFKY